MLDRAGLATSTLDTTKDIYTDSSTKIKTDEGLTTPINITQGVEQGCPLSPILFNFVMEGALAAINSANDDGFHIGEITIKSLAYGDNPCIISERKEHLNNTLSELSKFTKWAGLSFSTHKCASLTCVNNTPRRYIDPFSPMQRDDNYKYLVILSSRDRRVQDVAWSQLTSTLKCRGNIKENLTSSDIVNFLNTPASPEESRTTRDVRSLWI